MSKKMKLSTTIMCLIIIGCIGGFGYVLYNTQKQMSDYKDKIYELTQEIEKADMDCVEATNELDRVKAELSQKEEEYTELQKELEKANVELQDIQKKESSMVSAAVTNTPGSEAATSKIDYPVQAAYHSGYSDILVITGPDANGICTGDITIVGNKGKDHYTFSGLLDAANGVISFSDCTDTWESNGADGATSTRYTGGSGALVYIGNDTWRFDDHTGGIDSGKTFSYLTMYDGMSYK